MNHKEPQVLLVDFQDNEIGVMNKSQAHREAKLHRAFSVFLYNEDKILLQQRAKGKYHCGLLWTNTCCSHPEPGEDIYAAAFKRIKEETGIHTSQLIELFTFFYCCPLDHSLTEFECDHVLVGNYSGPFQKNPIEVEDMKWISCQELEREMIESPHQFTPWFMICAPKVIQYIRNILTDKSEI